MTARTGTPLANALIKARAREDDLRDALTVIGQTLADATIPPTSRIARAKRILTAYRCWPPRPSKKKAEASGQGTGSHG